MKAILLISSIVMCLSCVMEHSANSGALYTKSGTIFLQGLPSALVKNYPIPTPGSIPNAIITGADNHTLWFTEYNASKIGEFDSSKGQVVKEYSINSGAMPATLAIDKQGLIWFTDQNQNSPSVWSLNSTTGTLSRYLTGVSPSDPIFVLVDPSTNNVWFTDYYGNYLGEISSSTHIMTKHSLPSSNSHPVELAKQNESSYLWVTEETGKIARFDLSTNTTQEFNPSVSIVYPVGIVVSRDGNVWLSEHGGSSVTEFSPSNSTWKKYPTSQSEIPPGTGVATLAIDQQGRLWFAEHYSNRIGRLDTSSGQMVEFALPIPGAYSLLDTVDAYGNFWFTEASANQIGMIPGNAKSGISIVPLAMPAMPVTAGSSSAASYRITNNNSTSTLTLGLNVTSSFTANYFTTRSEISLSNYSIVLGPGQSKIVTATLTPDFSVTSGVYAAGLVASDGRLITVGNLFFQVSENPFHLLETLIPWILISAGVALLVVFVFQRRRKMRRLGTADVLRTKTSATAALFLLLLAQLPQVGLAWGKCPGLPQSGTGPDIYGIALDVASVAFFALVAYFLIRSKLRGQNP